MIATYRVCERCGSPVAAVCPRSDVVALFNLGARKMAGLTGFEPILRGANEGRQRRLALYEAPARQLTRYSLVGS
jgi:hypothetical protein